MAYASLGARPVVATPDTTGNNEGNWTAMCDNSVIGANVPYFELYHLYIKSPVLSAAQTSAQVMLNTNFWDATLVAQLNSWDPSQPMLLTPGDTIYILFDVPTSQTPAPIVTCWFRYDIAILNT